MGFDFDGVGVLDLSLLFFFLTGSVSDLFSPISNGFSDFFVQNKLVIASTNKHSKVVHLPLNKSLPHTRKNYRAIFFP